VRAFFILYAKILRPEKWFTSFFDWGLGEWFNSPGPHTPKIWGLRPGEKECEGLGKVISPKLCTITKKTAREGGQIMKNKQNKLP